MPRFEQEKMVKLVSELRKSIVRLESISNHSLEEFRVDPDKIGSSKYHLDNIAEFLGWNSKN